MRHPAAPVAEHPGRSHAPVQARLRRFFSYFPPARARCDRWQGTKIASFNPFSEATTPWRSEDERCQRFCPANASCAGVLPFLAFFLGRTAGFAIDPRIIDVAGVPQDRAGGCLLAQPLAANAAMRTSFRFILFHNDVPRTSPLAVAQASFLTLPAASPNGKGIEPQPLMSCVNHEACAAVPDEISITKIAAKIKIKIGVIPLQSTTLW